MDKTADIAISLDPDQLPTRVSSEHSGWLELLSQGLTFDVLGLLPDVSAQLPNIGHRFDLDDSFEADRCECVRIVLGPHLSGGEKSLPIVRVMAWVAAELSRVLPGVAALCWPPSASLIGPSFFRSTVSTWTDGGAFPALGLTAFRPIAGGGLESEGLAYFTGQEMRLEPDNSGDQTTASHLAMRLVNQLVQHGPLKNGEAVTAPDGGQLRLEPSPDGRTVHVWRG